MFHCKSNPKTTGNYPSPVISYFFILLVDAGTGVELVVNSGLFIPPPS